MMSKLEEDKTLQTAEREKMEEEARAKQEEIDRIKTEVEEKERLARELQVKYNTDFGILSRLFIISGGGGGFEKVDGRDPGHDEQWGCSMFTPRCPLRVRWTGARRFLRSLWTRWMTAER